MSRRDRIKHFITNNFYVAEGTSLTDDESLLESGIVDSTGVLEIISFVESEFGIQVGDGEMVPDNLDSIGRIVGYVERKTG